MQFLLRSKCIDLFTFQCFYQTFLLNGKIITCIYYWAITERIKNTNSSSELKITLCKKLFSTTYNVIVKKIVQTYNFVLFVNTFTAVCTAGRTVISVVFSQTQPHQLRYIPFRDSNRLQRDR